MRRSDKEIKDLDEIERIIKSCKVCRVAMTCGGAPYIVPMNFGYEIEDGRLTLYFHSAREGRKIDALRENPEVCFEMDRELGLAPGPSACSYGYRYESVVGWGTAGFVEDFEAKVRALRLLMEHAAGAGDWTFDAAAVEKVSVIAVAVSEYSAKASR